jgi:hypothetical protein
MNRSKFFTLALVAGGQLHATATLPPEKEPLYPLDRRLGELQSQSGRSEEKILIFTGTRTPTPQSESSSKVGTNTYPPVKLRAIRVKGKKESRKAGKPLGFHKCDANTYSTDRLRDVIVTWRGYKFSLLRSELPTWCP